MSSSGGITTSLQVAFQRNSAPSRTIDRREMQSIVSQIVQHFESLPARLARLQCEKPRLKPFRFRFKSTLQKIFPCPAF
jgi:hypothetical protein